LIERLMNLYSARHQGALTIDKAVYYEPFPMHRLAKLLPGTRFIHLVRDGRDVAMSWCDTWFGPRSIAEAAKLWADHAGSIHHWAKENAGLCLELKYEDLINNPEKAIQTIGEFLNMTSDQTEHAIHDYFAKISDSHHHSNLKKDILAENRYKWKTQMKNSDQELFCGLAGETLVEFGYVSDKPDQTGASNSIVHFHLLMARLSTFFSALYWKRIAMRFLPFVLVICGALHIPITKVLLRK